MRGLAMHHKRGGPIQPINRAVADLQAKPLNDDLASLGLKSVAGTFTGAKKPDRVVFFLYYARQK
jgi:hypothetical protein